ncbi:MAG: (E)-4-hydroxy-3-methylbut-2-enyl-diphosphate synthase [Chlamydiota bacterium]
MENSWEQRPWKARSVQIGRVSIGGAHPIAVQSMTNTDTNDIPASVDQVMRLVDAGADLVRLTVQGKREAFSLDKIKNILIRKGYAVPLIADIHFYPPAALLAAEFVDKIRINPGNFADKRASFKQESYTIEKWAREKKRLEEKFTPLVLLCKKRGVALRIGANHGSLSDRILNAYGDTPKGMVESVIEFAEICRKHDYHQLVFSLKSSNPLVMMAAYRLFVSTMQERRWAYPLHVGVTEAGAQREGRIKSFLGIGALLLEGIGDTVRISLTEDPVREIPAAKQLVRYCNAEREKKEMLPFFGPFSPSKKPYLFVLTTEEKELSSPTFFRDLGMKQEKGVWQKTVQTPDGIVLKEPLSASSSLDVLLSAGLRVWVPSRKETCNKKGSSFLGAPSSYLEELSSYQENYFFLDLYNPKGAHARREILQTKGAVPCIFFARYPAQAIPLEPSVDLGPLLADRLGEGICLDMPLPLQERREQGWALLQAARLRSVKTEFISCPSCGRTLFDLEQVTERIRAKTGHLPGVKIAVMGCIVNGPGEMADADFGYVGSRPGKIDLYIGKTRVKQNIPFADAERELITLLQEEGKWIDPPSI